MPIDPKILARIRGNKAQTDSETDPELESESIEEDELPGLEVTGESNSLSLAVLRGSEKQVKWATTIRQEALDLKWADRDRIMLIGIADATWWIANKDIAHTLKFKEPLPHQFAGASSQQTAPAMVRKPPMETTLNTPSVACDSRVNEAADWARSVSQNPKLAEAAILAVLSRLYKGDMQNVMRSRANELIDRAQAAIDKDVEAIRKMLNN